MSTDNFEPPTIPYTVQETLTLMKTLRDQHSGIAFRQCLQVMSDAIETFAPKDEETADKLKTEILSRWFYPKADYFTKSPEVTAITTTKPAAALRLWMDVAESETALLQANLATESRAAVHSVGARLAVTAAEAAYKSLKRDPTSALDNLWAEWRAIAVDTRQGPPESVEGGESDEEKESFYEAMEKLIKDGAGGSDEQERFGSFF